MSKSIFNLLIRALYSCKASVNYNEMHFPKDNISHSVLAMVDMHNIYVVSVSQDTSQLMHGHRQDGGPAG